MNVFYSLILCSFLFIIEMPCEAQPTSDTLNGRNIYKPTNKQLYDSLSVPYQENTVEAKLKDSLEVVRQQYIADSLEARVNFVRDSIQHRQHILDSLIFLKNELPKLLQASLKASTDEVFMSMGAIKIIGDTMLSNYTCLTFPYSFDKPYVPWKKEIDFYHYPPKLIIDSQTRKINAIQSTLFNSLFVYGKDPNCLRINKPGAFLNNRFGKFYKVPFDSIWFDTQGRVKNSKHYIELYKATDTYQKGAFLFSYPTQIIQYEYSTGNITSVQKVIDYYERWTPADQKKISKIINYTLTRQGDIYILSRKNDPVNAFSDGTFTYEFESNTILKSCSFKNTANTENWKCFIELNPDGNVSRYVYENNGVIRHTLLVNYSKDPKARYKVETITCQFDEYGGGTSQRNNMTGKSRERNMETGDWSEWK